MRPLKNPSTTRIVIGSHAFDSGGTRARRFLVSQLRYTGIFLAFGSASASSSSAHVHHFCCPRSVGSATRPRQSLVARLCQKIAALRSWHGLSRPHEPRCAALHTSAAGLGHYVRSHLVLHRAGGLRASDTSVATPEETCEPRSLTNR